MDNISADNIRRRIVCAMFPPSIFVDRCVDFRSSMIDCRCDVSTFDLRRSMRRSSMIDVSTFKDRMSPFEDRCHDVSTFGDRCVDFPCKIDVSTFGDGCVDLRRPMIDVSTFGDR